MIAYIAVSSLKKKKEGLKSVNNGLLIDNSWCTVNASASTIGDDN